MRDLFIKITETLGGFTSLEKFESWLYLNEYISNRVENDEVVLELLSINFKKRRAIEELERFYFKTFNKEDYILKTIELCLNDMIPEYRSHSIEHFFSLSYKMYNQTGFEYEIIDKITSYMYDYDEVNESYYPLEKFIESFKSFCEKELKPTISKDRLIKMRY